MSSECAVQVTRWLAVRLLDDLGDVLPAGVVLALRNVLDCIDEEGL